MHVTALLQSLFLYKSLVLGDVTSLKQDHACSLWKYYDNTTNECQCGSNFSNTIQCSKNENTISIRICSCMTLDNTSLDPVVMGNCLYSCHYLHLTSANSIFYEIGTNSTTELNNVTCRPYNRKGVMCGECIEGDGLLVYSYSLSCCGLHPTDSLSYSCHHLQNISYFGVNGGICNSESTRGHLHFI